MLFEFTRVLALVTLTLSCVTAATLPDIESSIEIADEASRPNVAFDLFSRDDLPHEDATDIELSELKSSSSSSSSGSKGSSGGSKSSSGGSKTKTKTKTKTGSGNLTSSAPTVNARPRAVALVIVVLSAAIIHLA